MSLISYKRRYSDIKYKEQNFYAHIWARCTWENCDFHRVGYFWGCRFHGCTFTNCTFRGQHTYLGATFKNCRFIDCTFTDVSFGRASLTDCSISGTITNVVFYGREAPKDWRTKFRNVELSGAELTDTDFRMGLTEEEMIEKYHLVHQNAPYETQVQHFMRSEHIYPVRITSARPGTWYLRPWTYRYRPFLVFWGMAMFQDDRCQADKSAWTLWFAFRESPSEHRDKAYHDGLVRFTFDDKAPNHLLVPGFTFELFVDPSGTIATGEILESTGV